MTNPADPEATGSYYLCRNMRFGCPWSTRWLPGAEAEARKERQDHERWCARKPPAE
jgi:hypothetical protein